MSVNPLNDAAILLELEEQFDPETACQANEYTLCDESVVWKRTHRCCGHTDLVCAMHKYGVWTDTLAPCHPKDGRFDGRFLHEACKTKRTWVDALLEDTWERI